MTKRQLHQAYLETDYLCYVHQSSFKLKVGKNNPALDKLLMQTGLREASFITAWNPFSGKKTLKQNEKLNRKLDKALKTNQAMVYLGQGRNTECTFFEDSFLALGLTKKKAVQLAIDFQQNAIIFYKLSGTAQLIWTAK